MGREEYDRPYVFWIHSTNSSLGQRVYHIKILSKLHFQFLATHKSVH